MAASDVLVAVAVEVIREAARAAWDAYRVWRLRVALDELAKAVAAFEVKQRQLDARVAYFKRHGKWPE